MRAAHSWFGPDGQCASIVGSGGLFREKGLRGPIAAHPRSDRCVQQVASEEDRAFSRDLLKRAASAGTALLRACAASNHAVASFDHPLRPETAHCQSLISHSRLAISLSCASGLGGLSSWSKKYTPLTFATSGEVASHTRVSAPFSGLRATVAGALLWLCCTCVARVCSAAR